MKAEKIQDFEQKAFDLLSLLEGFKPRAYYDSEGIPHIGYGFNLKISTNLYALKEEFDFIGNNKQSKKVEEYQDALEKLCFYKPEKKKINIFLKKALSLLRFGTNYIKSLISKKAKKEKKKLLPTKKQ